MLSNPVTDEIIRRSSGWTREELLLFINEHISNGQIVTPDYSTRPTVNSAGGTNFCPNSDFAWSHLAATTSGITPTTPGDTNHEIYRVYRQAVGADISSTRVRSSGHGSYLGDDAISSYKPDWDRIQGVIRLGWDGQTVTESPGALQTWYDGYRTWTTPFATEVRNSTISFSGTLEPYPGVGGENWGVIWTGQIRFKYAEATTFKFRLDDYVKLVVDGITLADIETVSANYTAPVTFTPADTATWYNFELRFSQATGPYDFDWRWTSASLTEEAVPIDATTDWIKHAATSGSNYDIAIHMTNNWLQNNRFRYVRCALATADATALPVGTKLFAGYWVKRTDATEGWADGDNFTATARRHAPAGTRQLEYKVVAKTDSGVTLVSATIAITDAPLVLDEDNYYEITYTDAAGFIEFEVYRKEVSTGQIDLISVDRNSDQLWAYDIGQSIRTVDAYPVGDLTDHRAYAEVAVDAVPYSQQLNFHNLKIRVPAALNTTLISAVYLRIGLTGPVASNRQLILDTVWESDSYNVWSPSAFDDYPSPRSTTMVTAPPNGGAGTGDLPSAGGGSSCLWEEHEVALRSGWEKLSALRRGHVIAHQSNAVERISRAIVSQWYELKFDNGLTLRVTPQHKLARSLDDSSGIQVDALEVGNSVLGGIGYETYPVKLIYKKLHIESIRVVVWKHTPNSADKLSQVGNSESGAFVYSHNSKFPDV